MSPQFRGLVLLLTAGALGVILWRLLVAGVTLAILGNAGVILLLVFAVPTALLLLVLRAVIALLRRRQDR